jgi:Ca-activated chloride channel family protein
LAVDRHRGRRAASHAAAWAGGCCLALLATLVPGGVEAQRAAASSPAPAAPASGDAPKDPYRAYESGRFDRALEGFSNVQVERPEDPVVQLNLGSTYYKLDDFAAAEREYARAARAEDDRLRAEALYNLGNAAYRQGRLEEAIERYRAALEVDSEDRDAKYNLEFVQRELERRQQEQPEPDQQQQDQQQDQQQGQSQPEQQESSQDRNAPQPRDSDQDGLPDQVEQRGRNPTDPRNPDTDGDGRPDGEEDRNANGQVDPGESDPNVADQPADPQGSPSEADASPREDPTEMSAEQAEHYLQGLEEERPDERRAKGRVRRLEKDW